jgi:hypothetical protein
MQTGIQQFSLAKLSFFFSAPALSVLLLIFLVLYIVAASALWYHWSKYGMGRREISVFKTLFVFISAILFVFAALGVSYL